ncbi:hypothetical protein M0802_001265 [Mischocyttarus mexicanus]|nr:hypothetical protein M0802_001265 [Mischocyttarus mexicanus]
MVVVVMVVLLVLDGGGHGGGDGGSGGSGGSCRPTRISNLHIQDSYILTHTYIIGLRVFLFLCGGGGSVGRPLTVGSLCARRQ